MLKKKSSTAALIREAAEYVLQLAYVHGKDALTIKEVVKAISKNVRPPSGCKGLRTDLMPADILTYHYPQGAPYRFDIDRQELSLTAKSVQKIPRSLYKTMAA